MVQSIGNSVGSLGALASETRKRIEARARFSRVRKGQVIIEDGDRSTDVYFLLEGELRVLLFTPDGKEVSVRTVRPGEMFGELAAIDGRPRSATMVAVAPSEMMLLSRSDFQAIVTSTPASALWLANALAAQIRILTDRTFELAALNVRSRLHCELLRLAILAGVTDNCSVIRNAPTHSELANRIGSHREAVTRELRDLAHRGIVEQKRRCLTLRNISRLSAAVMRVSGRISLIFPAARSGALLAADGFPAAI